MKRSLPSVPPVRIHPAMRRPRNGFGMLALVMFIGIFATILALSYPALMRFEQISRVRQTWHILEGVRRATSQVSPFAPAPYPVFRQRIGTNPGRISQLFGPVNSGDAVNYPTACGGTFSAAHRNSSRQWEPLLSRGFDPAVGLATPLGVANDAYLREDQGGGVFHLIVAIDQADLSDITMLDQFDNNDGATAGTIRWDNISGSTARLRYIIVTDAAC